MDHRRLLDEFIDPYVRSAESYSQLVMYDADEGLVNHRVAAAGLVRKSVAEMDRLQPAVQEIARAVGVDVIDPHDFDPETHGAAGYLGVLAPGRRLQGWLQTAKSLSDAMRAEPDLAVSGEGLHPWAWDAAAALWNDGHLREAVNAAALQVELHLQAKLDRTDLAGKALVQEAFSLSAPDGQRPRLRFSDFPPDSDSYRSVHEGALHCGLTVVQVIRNISTHTTRQASRQVRLEQLVFISYWARLVDHAGVDRGEQGHATTNTPES